MKNLLVIFMTLMMSLGVYSQDKQYIKPGVYKGEIVENGSSSTYIIEFDSEGYAYHVNSDGHRMSFDFKKTTSEGRITILQWINTGGIWTETHSFMITKFSNSVIQVVHIRYVTNDKGTDHSDDFFYGGSGNLYLEN